MKMDKMGILSAQRGSGVSAGDMMYCFNWEKHSVPNRDLVSRCTLTTGQFFTFEKPFSFFSHTGTSYLKHIQKFFRTNFLRAATIPAINHC